MGLFLFIGIVACVLVGLYLLNLISKALYVQHSRVPVRDANKGHHWVVHGAFPVGHYCNVCKLATGHGAQCDFCGIIVDSGCLRKANKTHTCKQLSTHDVNQPVHHLWVSGNLPPGSICAVCHEMCGDGPGIRDRRCVWCQRAVHTDCAHNLGRQCDYGEYRKLIVPPNCVCLKTGLGWSGRRVTVIDHIEVEHATKLIKDWSPMIVVANRKSGNGDGERALSAFRRLLNPVQVIDLAEVQPEIGLRWCQLLSGVHCVRLLVAGGDGTVGWVLSTIEKLRLEPKPQVALLPLGTGNDLSRTLGWGSGFSGAELDAAQVLAQLTRTGVPTHLDRWTVSISPRRRFGLRPPNKTLQMSNYFSVGVDAAVTLNFHNCRDTLPRAMSSRLINKMLFFKYGTQDVVERVCNGLSNCLELSLDDKVVELPALEGIVVLNIPHWGAGVVPWQMQSSWHGSAKNDAEFRQQRIDDGLLEVLGLYSSFHIAQMQVGMGEPYRVGQCSKLGIRLFSRALPMQCDGEPWLQQPAHITITRHDQAVVLADSEHALGAAHISSFNTSPVSSDNAKPKFF